MSINPELKVAIIGFGEMGKRHSLEYHHATRGKINFTAVVEPEDARYEEGCAWYGKRPTRYKRIKDMLSKEKLAAIIIASPNCFHYENLKDCMTGNLPLMLEKPLDSTFEKICEIARLTNSYKAPIMVDHVMRYAPIIQKAKQLITSGAIGKVCSFNFVQYHGGGALFTTYRRTMAGGGGQLIEKGTHDLDVAFYLCGAAPRKVTGICRLQKFGGNKSEKLTCSTCDDFKCANRVALRKSSNAAVKDIDLNHDLCAFSKTVDVYDNEICLVECTNNIFGSYAHCFFVQNHFSRRYEIIGTNGILYIELSMREKIPNCDGRISLSRAIPGLPEREEYKFDYEGKIHYNGGPFAGLHFYNMIQGKAKPFTTVEDAFAAEMVGVGAMKSSEEHRHIDLEKDIIPEDLLKVFRKAYRENV
ncbi:MAG: Inositol 2-dehydrogenase [Candidatus Uhrbacteria bacterium GW2011_GWF2_39_13]|uniref:Inositol 2-dehydrogenase n=1 Tax=Candidatus Uhrbacteria bacterium GW2011_GWF2_39_13 TaxID=1618995 RepID=A0A0G0MJH4_9BACT|nr:MAG: Inositol 2-dehydrogenase [Candidatus Uhrbacteria bacterium GW2011_GWF2_39_13]